MAIAKMEKRSATVWTKSSTMPLAIGGGLAFISLFLLWGAVKSFMVRTSYVEAAALHDTNRRQEVKASAERARSWGSHAESSELLAKVLVESNNLDAADKIYVQAASGQRRAMGLCGQGIVLLRKADGEKDAKKAAEFARKAKDRFNEAKAADGKLVEAQIGGASADLILGVKSNDAAKINAARVEFAKIHKALVASDDLAANVTREGFMDLYVGLARAYATKEKFSPESLSYAGSARRYLPTSMSLYALELSLQAQQMVDNPPPTAEIRAARTFERMKQLKERIVTSKTMGELSEPWFALTLAAASALARGSSPEDIQGSKELLSLAQQGKGQDMLLAETLEASLAMEAALKPEMNWNKRQTNYSQGHRQFMTVNAMKELQEPSRAILRAALLNNQAFFEEDQAAQGGGEPRYEQAVNLLKRALEAEQAGGLPEGSYEVRRNLAVIQKRRDKPDAAEHFDAAQRLAATRTEERIRQDLTKLQEYFGAK
jgi:hypothetical protein